MRADLITPGRTALAIGTVLVVLGIVLVIAGKRGGAPPGAPSSGWGLGRLPGDIHVDRGNYSFHFPIVTCILLSIVLTLIFMVVARLLGR